jgi:predicted GNAT family acetyltransferase
MTNEQYIQTITEDAEDYFRSFGLADHISHQEGSIEWIVPLSGYPGPSLVFKVSFSDKTEDEIEELIPGLQNDIVPTCWVLSPISNPKLFDILYSKGFEGSLSGSGEHGMAMDMNVLTDLPAPSNHIEVKKVTSMKDFKVWMDVVNTALHGWDLLTIEHFSVWLEREEFAFYLGYLDGVPITTAAVLVHDKSAGIEFVSTQEQYRCRGAGYSICHKALSDLQSNGIQIATLCSSAGVDKFYGKLGFKSYYEQVFFCYKKKEQGK